MIKINVEVNNKPWHKKIKNPKKYLGKKLKKISKIIPFFEKKNITFTIFLTNSLGIKKLNKKFRRQNKPTDVLSFPYHAKKELKKYFKEKKIYLGDIAISYEYIFIKKNKCLSNQKVLIKTFIHGFLHLLGFDHNKIKEFNKMYLTEKKIYNRIISKIDKT